MLKFKIISKVQILIDISFIFQFVLFLFMFLFYFIFYLVFQFHIILVIIWKISFQVLQPNFISFTNLLDFLWLVVLLSWIISFIKIDLFNFIDLLFSKIDAIPWYFNHCRMDIQVPFKLFLFCTCVVDT